MFFYVGIILDGASYNILAMILMLAGIINLMDSRSSKKKVIPQGILMFLIFYTKQNIGVYYIISVITYELILNRHKKGTIWNLVKMGAVAAGLLMGSIIVMNYLGILSGFINYAILGIKEFKENLFAEKAWLFIILALVWVFDVWGVIAHHTTKNMFSRKTKILLIFTIANILTIYPFANEYHIKYAFFITILLAIYFFDKIVAKTAFSAKMMDKIIVIITTIGFFVTVNQVNMQCFDQVYIINGYETIEGYGINKELYDNLIRYEKYLETTDNKVLCLSKYSNFYSVIYKDFNGKFDILNLGNFGVEGEKGLIKEIEDMEDTEFVLYQEYNTQEPYELRKFIKENYKLKHRDIGFEVYHNE